MKKRLSVTVEETLLDKLDEIAEEENRTVSNLVETIIMDYLSRREELLK